jgi:signal transduction histidine kinase
MPITAPGVARYLIGTVIFSTAIAVALTAFGSHRHGFGQNFVYSQCIGLITYATIDFPRRLLWPESAPTFARMAGLVAIAAPVGWFGGSFIASVLMGDAWSPRRMGLDAVLGFLALTAGAGFAGAFYFWTREQLMASERSAAEARLKVLQAQIEPHFLFNTLANLQALIDVDPKRAQEMLRHLDGYLRATLATTRAERGTLAEEFALLKSYLEILAIRMGPRLAFELELPAELGGARLPPMLLQPLVENAIRHGLEPKVEGGRVRVAAREERGALVLLVEDTGQGFGNSAAGGTGVGLAHVKERLAAIYGDAATMQAGDNEKDGGVSIALRLPLER